MWSKSLINHMYCRTWAKYTGNCSPPKLSNADLDAAHAENRAVEIDILATGELRVKAGADLEQACDSPPKDYSPLGRLGDAAQDLEECALAGSIAPDNPQDLAALDLKAYIFEGPELLHLITQNDLSSADDVDRIAREIAGFLSDHIAQRRITLVALVRRSVPHQIPFG